MKVVIIGGGVIGGGWVVWFLFNGWEVVVFDLDLEVSCKINEVIMNVLCSFLVFYDKVLFDEGMLIFYDNLEEVVWDVDWV